MLTRSRKYVLSRPFLMSSPGYHLLLCWFTNFPSLQATVSAAPSLSVSQDQAEETASQESNPESAPQTPPSKVGSQPSVPVVPTTISTSTAAVSVSAETISSPVRPIVPTTTAAVLPASVTARSAPENIPAVTSAPANSSSTLKDDDNMSFPSRRSSPAVTEIGLGRGITRGLTSQGLGSAPISIGPVSGNGSVSALTDLSKRNMLNTDERINSGGISQQLISPLGNKAQPQQVLRTTDTISSDSSNTNESTVLGGRIFSPPVVSGVQWRPQNTAGLQNQSEAVSTFQPPYPPLLNSSMLLHMLAFTINFLGVPDLLIVENSISPF